MLDKEHELAVAQSMINAAGSYGTTHSYNLGAAQTPILAANPLQTIPGVGPVPLMMRFLITTTFLAGAGAAEVAFQIITGSGVDGGGIINAGQEVIVETEPIPKATLVAGYYRDLVLPRHRAKQYIAGRYVITTNPGTAGAFSCWFGPQDAFQHAPTWV